MPTTRLRVLAPAALLVLTAAACGGADTDAEGSRSTSGTTTSTESAPPPLTGEEVHWGYTGDIGPTQWAALSPDFAACEDGRTQSPIDLTPGSATATEHLDLDYGDIDEHLVDNGHSVQLVDDDTDEDVDDHLGVGGVDYGLQQFHFHAPSEHTVDGRHAPLEMHLVHQAADGRRLVIGILLLRGAASEADRILSQLPEECGDEIEVDDFDLAALLPRNTSTLRYTGSLTTAPFSEGIQWFLTVPKTVSAQGIRNFQTLFPDGDSRQAQPLNGRRLVADLHW